MKISDYKEWHNIKNIKFDKLILDFFKKFDNHDKNHYRIYLDFFPNIKDYNYKTPYEIVNYLKWIGYNIYNDDKGLCYNTKQIIKIGKVLNDMGRQDLLKIYADSRKNILKNFEDLSIVISRHTYDIAGQSTNRRWTTCHDLKDKIWNCKYLYQMKEDMERGVLVSYIIKKEDKNIKDPLSRILIHYSGYGVATLGKLQPSKEQYGIFIPGFYDEILKFCNKFNRDLNQG